MDYFTMKALTLDGDWFEFSIADAPVRYSADEFALLRRPNTPRLKLKTLLRGITEYKLFEGDIISAEGRKWLVCYERGFYAIDESYITRQIHTFSGFEIAGNCFTSEFKVPISMRSKHLFKWRSVGFRIEDVLGFYDEDSLLLRCVSQPVPHTEIQQCCGLNINGKRAYLGDKFEQGIVKLHNGVITFFKDNEYRDVATGGII